MGTFIGFTLFSALEGLGIYFMAMSGFRLRPTKHVNYFIPFLVVMVVQSFLLREEVDYSFITPIISILLFVLFFTLYLKLPLIWSFIITLVGYTAFGTIQWVLMEIMFGGLEGMKAAQYGGYILQTATAAVQFIITFILMRYAIGFIADFEKLKIKSEKYITISMIVLTMLGLTLVAFDIKAMFIIAASFIYFLYFAIKKEREENRY